jgi:hypothetical protein
MKKQYLLFILSFFAQYGFAQNVGIGTAVPQTNLHVSSTGSTIIRNEATEGFEASLELKTNGAIFDFLELRKWKTGAGGFLGTIPLDGLSQITTGASATGGLLIGTKTAQPIYFTTNNIERMRIAAGGNVGIGTLNPQYILHIDAGTHNGIYARSTITNTDSAAIIGVLDIPTGANARVAAIRGESKSTTSYSIGVYGIQNGGGFGVAGSVKEAGAFGWGAGVFGEAGLNGVATGNGGYGVYGANNNTGGTAGYFSDLYGSSTSYALKTNGKIQLANIGETAGKVLTSDATGNASWQSLSGTHNHYGEFWTGNTTGAGLRIDNNNTTAYNAAGIDVRMNNGGTNQTVAVSAQGNSANAIAVWGSVNTSSSFGITNVAVMGTAGTGTGVFGSSISGYSIYANKTSPTATGGVAKFENTVSAITQPVVLITNTATDPISLELNNGYIKVSGTNKMAFVHTATAANSSGHITTLSYNNPDATDLVFITHNYNPAGGAAQYLNVPTGVYFSGGAWRIYNEDQTTPMFNGSIGKSFNVMVIKQ